MRFKKNITISVLTVVILSTTTACYRMPTEDDYCVIPSTNNPVLTREKNSSLAPNMNY